MAAVLRLGNYSNSLHMRFSSRLSSSGVMLWKSPTLCKAQSRVIRLYSSLTHGKQDASMPDRSAAPHRTVESGSPPVPIPHMAASATRTESLISALSMQESLRTVHDLRSLGLDKDVDLPRICVVGKQSSGKSSVIEALTGIAVPRAAGTCTRCAYEVSTRHTSDEFQCIVSLRYAPSNAQNCFKPA